jgi:hypothetical protein
MSLRRLSASAVVLVLAFSGCGQDKKAAQEAAAKKAEEAEIDVRAKAIAGELVQKATDDEAKRQALAAQQAQAAHKAEWQRVVDHPELFLEPSNLETAGASARRLTSISITNKSKYAVTDVRGTLDFHGGDNPEVVVAQVPITLSGSIGPGASMVFSERQHTLDGAAIELTRAATRESFTVVGVASVDPGGLEPPAPSFGDAGAPADHP